MVMHLYFRDVHKGETVWVVGSGKTLDHIAADFFDDKVTIAVNQALAEKDGRATYWVSNHHPVAVDLAERFPAAHAVVPTVEPVPPEHRRPRPLDLPNIVPVPVGEQHYARFDPEVHWPDDNVRLAVGPSSATLGMAWAEWVGARTIIVVGLDCGAIDGEPNSSSHVPFGDWMRDPAEAAKHRPYRAWEDALVRTAEFLRRRGVQVHSLNPWATLSLEGHKFTQ